MKEYYFLQLTPRLFLRELYSVLGALNSRNELNRLATWAEWRKLRHPIRLYRTRIVDEEKRIFHYSIQCPLPFAVAYFIYRLNRLINRTSRLFPQGSAKSYSCCSLTNLSKSHSIFV